MGDLPNVRAYLYAILVTTAGSFKEDHLKHVELVLQCLTELALPLTFANLLLRLRKLTIWAIG